MYTGSRSHRNKIWWSPAYRICVVGNSRLSPYTPQSVAASLAAVKRAGGTRISTNLKTLSNTRKVSPNPHRFREASADMQNPHTHVRMCAVALCGVVLKFTHTLRSQATSSQVKSSRVKLERVAPWAHAWRRTDAIPVLMDPGRLRVVLNSNKKVSGQQGNRATGQVCVALSLSPACDVDALASSRETSHTYIPCACLDLPRSWAWAISDQRKLPFLANHVDKPKGEDKSTPPSVGNGSQRWSRLR